MVIGIDPGPVNSGIAYFLRCSKTNNLKLEFAAQLETSNFRKDSLPFYILSVAVRMATDINLVADTEKIGRVKRIGFAIEQAAQHSMDNHFFIHSFSALLEAMRAPFTDYIFKMITVAPETVRRSLCLLKQKSYALRKQKTFEAVCDGLKVYLPRHDTSDAIALGIAAITSKRLVLMPTDFQDDALWPFFATEEELKIESEKRRLQKEIAPAPKEIPFDEELYSELFDEKDETQSNKEEAN